MKTLHKIIAMLFIALIGLPMASSAQPASVVSFFDKYSGTDGFTTINISPKMFQMVAQLSLDEELDEFDEIIENITGLNILIFENEGETQVDQKKFFNEISRALPKGYYEDLMSVQGSEENVRFLIKEKSKGVISELLMIVSDGEEFVCLSLTGAIDLDKVIELSKQMDIDGMEHLMELHDEMDEIHD